MLWMVLSQKANGEEFILSRTSAVPPYQHDLVDLAADIAEALSPGRQVRGEGSPAATYPPNCLTKRSKASSPPDSS